MGQSVAPKFLRLFMPNVTLWRRTSTPTSAFEALIEEGLADYHNGQTDEFDPTVEEKSW